MYFSLLHAQEKFQNTTNDRRTGRLCSKNRYTGLFDKMSVEDEMLTTDAEFYTDHADQEKWKIILKVDEDKEQSSDEFPENMETSQRVAS